MANELSNDQLEFNLGEDEVATDVAIAETPKTEEQQATQTENENNSHRDELNSINEGVQKRIAKLTARMREAERREQAAVEFARGLQNKTQTLEQKLVQTDYSRLNEAKARLDTQQIQLRQIIKRAREENDVDTETEAQERLAMLAMEQRQVSGWLQDQDPQRQPQREQQYVPQQQVQQAPRPQPNAKAEDWAARNEWFGKERLLTYGAWGIHQTLVEEEGVDPNSDEYYTELDRRLRDEFPRHFKDETPTNRQQRSAPAVAPATRSSGMNSARRTVRLSPSQVAIAKKLGVPLEEYAKYVKE
jgi:hypothetical protein